MIEDADRLEFQGRLNVDDLVIFQRVQAAILIRPVFRVLFVLLLLCGLIPLIGDLLRPDSPFREPGTALLAIMVSYLVLDQLGLRFVRYRIAARFRVAKVRDTFLRCDHTGVTWFPVDVEAEHVSIGWSLLRLISLPEGVAIAVRTTVCLFVPVRDLTADQRQRLETIARSGGATVSGGS